MKRLYIYIIGISLGLMACEFHTSDNGELDGFWQLSAVDTLATGGTADMRAAQISWAFQGHLLAIRNRTDTARASEFLFRFHRSEDSLLLFDPYVSLRDSGDIKIVDATKLYGVGIHRLEEQFKVLNLSGSHMSLQSEGYRLNFRRY